MGIIIHSILTKKAVVMEQDAPEKPKEQAVEKHKVKKIKKVKDAPAPAPAPAPAILTVEEQQKIRLWQLKIVSEIIPSVDDNRPSIRDMFSKKSS